MSKRDFLLIDDLSVAELRTLLDLADQLKASRRQRDDLAGRSIGMLFEKPSSRTRVSFEVGIAELGARPVILNAAELQIGQRETVEDVARVLSRYLHALVVRTFAQSRLDALAASAQIPVINALSDTAHPCQALADLLTIRERLGGFAGRKLAYLGDGNNVAHSLLKAGAMAGLQVVVASPPGFEPDPAVVDKAQTMAADTGGGVSVMADPLEAAGGADVLYTDVWASMGQESERETRLQRFGDYRIDERIVAAAGAGAIVMHCLPAHRGEEITADVLEGPQSVVWDQAENRLHAQKALLLLLLGSVQPRAGAYAADPRQEKDPA